MNRRAALFALVALALVFQGARGIWDPDEGRYVAVAWRMVESGDWWTPRLHHEVPHFAKPPLTYWTIAASIAVLGKSEWAARIPDSLAWIAAILLVHALARRLAPGREELAAVVQATSLLPFAAANIITTDTLLAACVTLGVFGFVASRAGFEPGGKAPFWMWVGFGLAFLTKGPPGLLALGAIVVFVLARDGFRGLRRLGSWPGFLLFLLLAFGWYAAQVAAHPDLLSYLFGKEIVGRVADPTYKRNSGIIGLVRAYGGVVLAGMLPWMPWAVARGVRMARAAREQRDARRGRAGRTSRPARSHESTFLLAWLLLPLAVFLISSSRLPLYLVQLAPPAALLIARALPEDALAPRRRRALLALWIVGLVALKGYASIVETDRDGRHLARDLRQVMPYPPLEICVVNRKPSYSLAFYLETEIERIDVGMKPPPNETVGYRLSNEDVEIELAESEPGTIFLVPRRYEKLFLTELDRLGWRAPFEGESDDFRIYSMPYPSRPYPAGGGAPAAAAPDDGENPAGN